MSARKKQSKCPEPINALLDLAGAVTLGLYAKNKIKRDFEKGAGEESLAAGTAVFGRGAMRRGSQGIINLGGLIGLNLGLKSIERKQVSNYQYVQVKSKKSNYLDEPKERTSINIWKTTCEDGSSFGLCPDDYSSADDYQDALNNAKNVTKPICDESVSDKVIRPTTKDKKYIWRKVCADGSEYGINPENYDDADDYEEALNKAINNRNKSSD